MLGWQDAFASDLRSAVRTLGRSPAFAAVAVLTLAVGIGAATAVFSVVDLLLFRSLPYPRAERLVSVGFSGPIDTDEFNVGNSYLDWQDRQTVFQSLTSIYPGGLCDMAGDPPRRIHCQVVEANFLSTLEIVPMLGRDFRPEDDRPGASRVALLAYGFWKAHFGGQVNALGKSIEIDGNASRVIGVLPESFEMPQLGDADVLLPEQMDRRAARSPNTTIFLRSFARLKDTVDIKAARQRMLPLFQDAVHRDVPPALRHEVHLVVRTLKERQVHDARLASWLLFGAVLALLALACANVTNLLLARAAARRGEMAMRMALGASRRRLLGQMLAEALVLSLTGALAGCAFAALLIRIFVAIAPEGMVRLNQARLDPRVLLFALTASVVAAMFVGLLPAWERLTLDALSGWRTAGRRRSWSRQALVAAQVALSLVLLSGASLLARSLRNLETQPLGFQPERVMTASFTLNRQRYGTPAKQDEFYSEVERQLARMPGVSAFALSDSMPPAGGVHGRPFSNMKIARHPPLPENGGMVAFRSVTPGYFRTLGIPILAGRNFEERERTAADTPVILSATLARRMFGTENPVGQQIDMDLQSHWLPIVGVAGDVKNSGLAETAEPEYYRLRTYSYSGLGRDAVVLLKTSLDENTVARWVRQQIASVDAGVPVKIAPMSRRVSDLSQRQRFVSALVGLFASFGLLLAATGLYGLLSFLVAQRTREIGVRMAMGATPRAIARMVERQAGIWTACGVLAGIVASFGLGRMASGLLFRVSPHDPVSLAAAAGVLALAAALAAGWPSYRASRVDPAVSLRQE
ncbi:MAG TPA: ABC transporter permease [Bryobacteraceae bacterium]|nr:ABC transporter permease [Bryobacteraceae bacterium]